MMTPTVHLNGSARSHLLDAACAAGQAVHAAMTALRETAPNGRDYYPQGPDALRVARNEYVARAEALETVYRELVQLAEAIADAEGPS